jgi:heat shock protein HslJ
MRRALSLFAVVALALVACGGGNSSGGDPTANPWLLESGSLNGESIPMVDGHPITLVFDADLEEAGGVSACNSYFGRYTLTGSELTFSDLGSTMMACTPEEVMDSESQYLAALDLVETFSVDGGDLTLQGEGVDLVFVADEAA